MKVMTMAAIMITAASICISCANQITASKTQTNKKMNNNKKQVVDLLKAIETGAAEPVTVINADKYIQHNLDAEDGLAGFGKLLQQLPPNSAKVNTVRVFQDGDFVVAHSEYNFFGPKIGFDIFRFEGGKIVEHWDNLQATPSSTNPSGHTMVDGPTEITEVDKTEANKAIVKSAVEDLLINGRMDKAPEYFNGNEYINHNPEASDGLTGLAKGMAERAKQGIVTKYHKVHKVLGEGNFVLAVSEGEWSGKPTAFYDLFRVQNGKITEHWDVVQEIPEKGQWKNQNGKF